MTAVFTVQIVCECACEGERAAAHGCSTGFPREPVEGTAKDARVLAARRGWEVRRGNQGRDVCPPCRVAQIQAAAAEAAEPE